MHEILIRLKLMKNSRIYEVYLDERLSFAGNLKMLQSVIGEDITDVKIYDPYKKIFLDPNIIIKNFNISSFMLLYLF